MLDNYYYDKTANQCIRKPKLEDRKIKDSRNKTGTGRKDWRFFDAMMMFWGTSQQPNHPCCKIIITTV